jgi:hypothetical protein
LRTAALRGDWDSWAQAWQHIDENACRTLLAVRDTGKPVELVLCSQHHALHFTPGPGGWLDRLQRRLQRPALKDFTNLP